MTGTFRVVNETRSQTLATRCARATGHLSRAIGLIGRKELPAGEGLIIQPCNSIHMFFMRFPIDAIFVDGDGVIRHAIHSIPPWRASRIVRGSRMVIELPAGTLNTTGTRQGDRVLIQVS